jgi:hypothetical protein
VISHSPPAYAFLQVDGLTAESDRRCALVTGPLLSGRSRVRVAVGAPGAPQLRLCADCRRAVGLCAGFRCGDLWGSWSSAWSRRFSPGSLAVRVWLTLQMWRDCRGSFGASARRAVMTCRPGSGRAQHAGDGGMRLGLDPGSFPVQDDRQNQRRDRQRPYGSERGRRADGSLPPCEAATGWQVRRAPRESSPCGPRPRRCAPAAGDLARMAVRRERLLTIIEATR